MKKLLSPSVVVAILSMLVVWTALPDSTFNYPTSGLIGGRASTVLTPKLVTATNAPVTIAAMTNVWTGSVVVRTIQNCGTNAVFYNLGGTVATTNYHGIIAGGVALKDGLGTTLDISRWPGTVTVMTASGTSDLAITELTSQ